MGNMGDSSTPDCSCTISAVSKAIQRPTHTLLVQGTATAGHQSPDPYCPQAIEHSSLLSRPPL
jgi:hypothetical protein